MSLRFCFGKVQGRSVAQKKNVFEDSEFRVIGEKELLENPATLVEWCASRQVDN